MVKQKKKTPTTKREATNKKPELKLSYREVLADYVTKRRALSKLEFQLNRYHNTIKISFVTGFLTLAIMPFNSILAVMPLMALIVYSVFQYKENERLKNSYEQIRYELELRTEANK
jgi:hypothetical protein